MIVPLTHYLILASIIFTLGAVGVMTRRNAIVIFMCIELMLNAVNLVLIAASRYLGDPGGQIMVFMVMTVAAAEAAVGLAVILLIHRTRGTVNVDDINMLKW